MWNEFRMFAKTKIHNSIKQFNNNVVKKRRHYNEPVVNTTLRDS